MNCKLIACDLDGTLLCDDSSISNENLNAIHRIKNNGIEFVINTGRTLYEIPKELLNDADIRYIIHSDGSVIYDKASSKILQSRYIDTETALKLFKLLDSFDTMIGFYVNGHPVTDIKKLSCQSYEYFNIDKNYRSVMDLTRKGVENLEKYISENDKIELINIFFKYPKERNHCAEILKEKFDIQFTTSMDNNIEITAKSISKGMALKKLCDILQIKKENVIALGDSKNDITMFDFAGTSLCAGNASDVVKEYADKQVCSNNEHIAEYICRNILGV